MFNWVTLAPCSIKFPQVLNVAGNTNLTSIHFSVLSEFSFAAMQSISIFANAIANDLPESLIRTLDNTSSAATTLEFILNRNPCSGCGSLPLLTWALESSEDRSLRYSCLTSPTNQSSYFPDLVNHTILLSYYEDKKQECTITTIQPTVIQTSTFKATTQSINLYTTTREI